MCPDNSSCVNTSVSEDVGVKPVLPTSPDPFLEKPTVLILVGLIASGKSTFAEALENHFPRFRRCNQDDLGSRQQVEELAYHTLREGRSPCIDRTNFNAIQRSYWSAIARAFPGTSISIIVFDTPYHVCASRLQRRTSHPTIKDARHGMTVLQKFASDFQMPSPDEGYDHIIYLQPADIPRPEYTRNDVLLILERLKASTRDAGTSIVQRRIETYFGHSGRRPRIERARGHHGGDGYRGFSGRHGSSKSPNWRRPSSDVATNREGSAAVANVPPMESSKGPAEEPNSS